MLLEGVPSICFVATVRIVASESSFRSMNRPSMNFQRTSTVGTKIAVVTFKLFLPGFPISMFDPAMEFQAVCIVSLKTALVAAISLVLGVNLGNVSSDLRLLVKCLRAERADSFLCTIWSVTCGNVSFQILSVGRTEGAVWGKNAWEWTANFGIRIVCVTMLLGRICISRAVIASRNGAGEGHGFVVNSSDVTSETDFYMC